MSEPICRCAKRDPILPLTQGKEPTVAHAIVHVAQPLTHALTVLADGDSIMGRALMGALIGGVVGGLAGALGWLFKKKK